ncbi:helix-turn-helix transcriptional regulator [Streptomyces synnematoformans]
MPPRRAISGRSQQARQRFAEELRLLRTQRGESLRQLGDALGWDPSLFHKLEAGTTIGSPEVSEALDTHYGTTPLLLALWEVAAADPTQFREQYRRYMTLEKEATSLWQFAVSVIPGLLQTEAYARELLSAGGGQGNELEQQVEARMNRRMLLDSEREPRFRAILSEAVLRTPLSDPQAWREQLEYLLEMADQPRVTIQVLPSSIGLYGLVSTDVMFLRLPEGRTVAYTENAHRGELVQENGSVERLQLAYDAVRDVALTPAESRKLIVQTLEEVPCDEPT